MRRRICIVGCGASGLSMLKSLLEHDLIKSGEWQVQAIEQRTEIGGVWVPAPTTIPPDIPATPLYDSLHTNLPHPIMAFRGHPFPSSTPLFPSANVVKEYLQSYADHFNMRPYIRTNTTVTSITRPTERDPGWKVEVQPSDDPNTPAEVIGRFDTIILCNGHFSRPFIPSISGLEAWKAQDRISHSMYYRNPTPFKNKTVLVIGAGPSAIDIAPELTSVAKQVYRSTRTGTLDDSVNPRLRGPVDALGDPGTVHFKDGTMLENVDCILFATGYKTSFSFLPKETLKRSLPPAPDSDQLADQLYDSGDNVFPLSMHLIPITNSIQPDELFFMGLPSRVVPFPLFQAQATAIIALLSRQVTLNTNREQTKIIERFDNLSKLVNGNHATIARLWHKLPDLQGFDYRVELLRFAGSSDDLILDWVPQWQRDLYMRKGELQVAWKEAKRDGTAAELVKGVGEGGENEWVDLMWRLIGGHPPIPELNDKYKL